METKLSKKNCEVFRLQFAIGEFDMVVFDPEEETCEIYEIKHNDKIVLQQCRHLLDKQKREDTAFRYGTIIGKLCDLSRCHNISRPSRREYTGRCGLFECRRIFEKVITYA